MDLQTLFQHLLDKIKPLVEQKKTGQYRFDVELNLSQGGIGDCVIETHTKERVKT